MKIFILEDDSACNGVIDWFKGRYREVYVEKDIENAAYRLLYENIYRDCDKYIFDASIDKDASVIYPEGGTVSYYGALSGIDFLGDLLQQKKLPQGRVAILTAFVNQVKDYPGFIEKCGGVPLIDKNSYNLTKDLLFFLEGRTS